MLWSNAERVRGDRAENLRLSAEILRSAIAQVPVEGDSELLSSARYQPLPELWLVGAAHHALGRLRSREAAAITEALEQEEASDPAREAERLRLQRQARANLLAAEQRMHGAPDPLRRGYVLNDLAGLEAEPAFAPSGRFTPAPQEAAPALRS